MSNVRASICNKCRVLRTVELMKRLFLLFVATSILAVVVFGVDRVRDTAEQVIDAGQSAIDVGQSAIQSGQGAFGQVRDTADAARQLNGACDLVRSAVRPDTSPTDSAALLQQAVGIVDGVVVDYPNVPGMSDLEGVLGAAKQTLVADPSGQLLKSNSGAVESACSRIPSLP